MRIEAADLGVKVSVVCPAYVQTPMRQSNLIVNAPRDKVLANMESTGVKRMEASRAARVILEGVSRNQAVIVFPGYARLAWLLYRIHPAFMDGLGRKAIRDFRQLRAQS